MNPHQGDIATFLQTSKESGGERTLLEHEIAPGGANGMPRNLLHAALMLKWGDGRLPRAYRLLEPILGLMAMTARRRSIDRKLEHRYLSGRCQ